MNTTILMMVANPIGNVPRNRLCWGWESIAFQIRGQRVYRALSSGKREGKERREAKGER